MDNVSPYFTAIEERFSARRGSILLLSTLDWALIETWREAGVPLEAVLRGIDTSFDRYEARALRAAAGRGRLRKVNGLAWCSQAVMEAAEQMVEAATGMALATTAARSDGFDAERVSSFLERNATCLGETRTPVNSLATALRTTAERLRELGTTVRTGAGPALDELDRTLTVLEERLYAALLAATPEVELAALRETADRELAAYRTRLGAVQARQVRDQFVHKRLLEAHGLPRLSLFYMGHGE